MKVALINRDDIDFGERRREEYGDLEKLAASIKSKGLIQPIAVWERPKPLDEDTKPYLLLAGGRRFHATFINKMQDLPCRIFTEPVLDDLLYREIELIENIERKDLTWAEQVNLQQEINDLMTTKHGHKIAKGNQHSGGSTEGWSQADTASLLNKSKASVSRDLELASALKKIPALAECASKTDALKLLDKMKKQAVADVLLEKIQAQETSGALDTKKKELIDNFIIRDFFDGAKKLPDGSFDIVEIDPPYAIDLQQTKKGEAEGIESYNEVDFKDYKKFLRKTMKEAYRVMAENSWLIVWFAQEPWFEDVYDSIISAGFDCNRIPGIWAKPNGQTRRPERYLANAYEPFFYARKGTLHINRQGRSNIFAYDPVSPNKKVHPTERPVELIQEVLSTFTHPGARILVPFMGSGNTLLAACNLRMSGVGFDLSKKYKDSYSVRVVEGTYGKYASYGATKDLTFSPGGV